MEARALVAVTVGSTRTSTRALVWLVLALLLAQNSGTLAQRFGRPQQYPGQHPGLQYPQHPGQRPPSLDAGFGGGGGGGGGGYPFGDTDEVLGAPCEYDEHCYSVEHTFCLNHKTCACKRGFVPSPAGDRCLATVGVSCSTKYDCSGLGQAGGPGGECRQGVCDCGDGYVPAPDGSCIRGAVRLADACNEELQCQTLGDGVVCVGGSCQCAQGRHAHRDTCVTNRALHEPCTEAAQCFVGKDFQAVVTCDASTHTCQCSEHYVDNGRGQCTAGVNGMKSVLASIVLAPILIQFFV